MKVKDLDGHIHYWNFEKCESAHEKSANHIIALDILHALYPFYKKYEDVKLPGTRLRVDILVPAIRLAIEVQGAQHNKFVAFFHKTFSAFLNAKKRDREKRAWLETNGFTLIALDEGDMDIWKTQIEDARNGA